jgi:hypothetical protein
MSEQPIAYPLTWPAGWPKTEPNRRETARFKTTISAALKNLKRQIELMGGTNTVLSSNYTLGAENPKESGVVAYFRWQQMDVAIPCDRWLKIEHNVQAIALTIEAMRGMERWGAKHMIKAMFTGFKALPAPKGSERPWWDVLGIPQTSTRQQIEDAYFQKCKTCHPDKGGTHEQMVELNDAYSKALTRPNRP